MNPVSVRLLCSYLTVNEFFKITSIRGKLEAAKMEIASDIGMNILEKLPVILEKLKEEARKCKSMLWLYL